MARADFQNWLDRVGQSFFDGDFDLFASSVQLPMVLGTRSADLEIATTEQLRQGFDSWCRMLRDQRATLLVRKTLTATMPEANRIDGTYSTYILSNAVTVVPPFESSMTLVRVDGRWLCTALASGVENRRYPIDLPKVSRDHAR